MALHNGEEVIRVLVSADDIFLLMGGGYRVGKGENCDYGCETDLSFDHFIIPKIIDKKTEREIYKAHEIGGIIDRLWAARGAVEDEGLRL